MPKLKIKNKNKNVGRKVFSVIGIVIGGILWRISLKMPEGSSSTNGGIPVLIFLIGILLCVGCIGYLINLIFKLKK